MKKLIVIMIIFSGCVFFHSDNMSAEMASPFMPLETSVTGVASYYSYECARLPMANGKPFDPENRTCASWFYKFGTVLVVKSLDTGRSTEVVVTDRGPNERLVAQGRIIDLSKRAFEDISPLDKGLTNVIVTVKR
jgi:rare lipoprotein A